MSTLSAPKWLWQNFVIKILSVSLFFEWLLIHLPNIVQINYLCGILWLNIIKWSHVICDIFISNFSETFIHLNTLSFNFFVFFFQYIQTYFLLYIWTKKPTKVSKIRNNNTCRHFSFHNIDIIIYIPTWLKLRMIS